MERASPSFTNNSVRRVHRAVRVIDLSRSRSQIRSRESVRMESESDEIGPHRSNHLSKRAFEMDRDSRADRRASTRCSSRRSDQKTRLLEFPPLIFVDLTLSLRRSFAYPSFCERVILRQLLLLFNDSSCYDFALFLCAVHPSFSLFFFFFSFFLLLFFAKDQPSKYPYAPIIRKAFAPSKIHLRSFCTEYRFYSATRDRRLERRSSFVTKLLVSRGRPRWWPRNETLSIVEDSISNPEARFSNRR